MFSRLQDKNEFRFFTNGFDKKTIKVKEARVLIKKFVKTQHSLDFSKNSLFEVHKYLLM